MSQPTMLPQEFQRKWIATELKERSASQSHINDLCAVLGVPSPTDADPKGEFYAFERGASKLRGGDGWADVWYRNHFAWEYKGLYVPNEVDVTTLERRVDVGHRWKATDANRVTLGCCGDRIMKRR